MESKACVWVSCVGKGMDSQAHVQECHRVSCVGKGMDSQARVKECHGGVDSSARHVHVPCGHVHVSRSVMCSRGRSRVGVSCEKHAAVSGSLRSRVSRSGQPGTCPGVPWKQEC
eukprot:1159378-Pelagomonas_calceolata.AAC.2